MPIPVFKPSIKRKDMQSVLSCMVTDIIGPGSIAHTLTETLSAEYGFSGGIAVREYCRAIEICFDVLNLMNGDKVLVSPLAPSAYAKAINAFGIEPVFSDVCEQNAVLDAGSVANMSLDGIKAIIVHAPLGQVPDMQFFHDLKIPVICDIGQALGATEVEGYLGSSAQILVLPMEPEGIATCGGGTLILAKSRTDWNTLKDRARKLQSDALLPDINASLGLVQWKQVPSNLEDRQKIFEIYQQSLFKGKYHTFVHALEGMGQPVAYTFPVILSGMVNEIHRYARKNDVETLMGFGNDFFEMFPQSTSSCGKAKTLMMNTVIFPLYPALGKKNVQTISRVLATLP